MKGAGPGFMSITPDGGAREWSLVRFAGHSLALELSSKHGVSTPCNVIRHQPSSFIKSSELDRNSCRAKFEHIHLLNRSKSVNLSYEGSEKMATCTSQAKISSDVGKPREPGRKSIGANAGVRRPGLH